MLIKSPSQDRPSNSSDCGISILIIQLPLLTLDRKLYERVKAKGMFEWSEGDQND